MEGDHAEGGSAGRSTGQAGTPPGSPLEDRPSPFIDGAFGSPIDQPHIGPQPRRQQQLGQQQLGQQQQQQAGPACQPSQQEERASALRPPSVAATKALSIRVSRRRSSLAALNGDDASPHSNATADGHSGSPHAPRRPEVWGWLQPGRPSLPHVLLQGGGVVLGRGADAFDERLLPLALRSSASIPEPTYGDSGAPAGAALGALAPATPPSARAAAAGSFSQLPEPVLAAVAAAAVGAGGSGGFRGPPHSPSKRAVFVELADTRVSRLHCWVSRDETGQVYLQVRRLRARPWQLPPAPHRPACDSSTGAPSRLSEPRSPSLCFYRMCPATGPGSTTPK